ncbi:MAG: response regulator [Deltaproteobacteria bacterium]|nr:response regulator [Deltaproteobacteria bacterium]MBW2069692.1 response regulator [Deltaproteobacteria bacterium]
MSRNSSESRLQHPSGDWRLDGELVLETSGLLEEEICKRKVAEDVLRRERLFISDIFNSIQDGICVLDLHFNIIRTNRSLERAFADKNTLLGRKCYQVYQMREEPCPWCPAVITLETGEVSVREVPFEYGYQSTRWFEISAFPFRDGAGNVVGVIDYIKDITERKHAQEERLQLEAQLCQAQKMEALGTLTGGIAHDFNNVLQGIQGYAELLLLGRADEENCMRQLREILSIAERGKQMTGQLLSFSRKLDSKLQPVELNPLVEKTEDLLRLAMPRMINIELELGPDLPTVLADATQIEQVLVNLANNARDSMPKGGILTISTANVSISEEKCRLRQEIKPGEYVELTITDTGHGMSAEMLEQIFQPFYTTKQNGAGAGLGLAMVKRIVANHSGHITVESSPGHGTTFKILLPVSQVRRTTPAEEQAAVCQAGSEKILLIEDEEAIRNSVKQMLEMFGYTVVCSAKGEWALELYAKEEAGIEVIILDLIMPGMGGKECLKELLKINPQARVLVASGYASSAVQQELLELGAKGFIRKPYKIEQVLTAVREILKNN